ncbi:hypothetical protein SAMN05444166_8483 [Singulisphaera sp. GP187]|nr:hypothetical protein SAMN05444166_8483 [Singulisphaera sp. GP187]
MYKGIEVRAGSLYVRLIGMYTKTCLSTETQAGESIVSD